MGKKSSLLIVLVLVVFVSITSHAEAGRVLGRPEEFAKANHLESYSLPVVYEKAKYSMTCWFQSLASCPSPRGRGH